MNYRKLTNPSSSCVETSELRVVIALIVKCLFVAVPSVGSEESLFNLTLCVPCVVTNYVSGPTDALFIYLFINSTIFIFPLHVSNYRVVHHQKFIVVYRAV